MSADQQSSSGFIRRVFHGATFLGAAQYALFAIGIVKTYVLARLVVPEIHGAVLFAATTVSFLNIFRLELREVVISDPEGNPARLMTQYVIEVASTLLSILIGSVVYLVSPSGFSPQVWLAVVILLVSRIFTALTSTPLYILHRDLRYGVVTALTLSGAGAGLAAAIIIALAGYPLYGLLADAILPVMVTGVGSWAFAGWRPSRAWDEGVVRDVLSFGFTLWTGGLLGKITFEFDDWLVGRRSEQELGFYGKAYSLAKMPMDVFAGVIGGIALSMYAQGAALGREVLARAYALTTWLLMRIVSWSSVVILAAAEEIVAIMLGPDWLPTVSLVRWMFVFVLGRPLFQNNAQLLVANREEKLFRRSSMVQAVVLVIAGPFLVWQWGAVGASIAVSIMMVFGVVFSHRYVSRLFATQPVQLYALPVVLTLVLSPALYLLGEVVGAGVWLSLFIKGTAATVLFGGFTYLIERRTAHEVIALVRENLFAGKEAPPDNGR